MRLRSILLRIGSAVVTLVFVLVFNFFLFRAVGDPKTDLARNPHLTLAGQQAVIHERGLDRSLWVQFERYVTQTLRGDLGSSFANGEPVSHVLMQALPNTLILIGIGTVLASVIGPWMGMVAGWNRGRKRDTFLTQGSVVLYSMPEFWMGMLLISLFAVAWPILPTGLHVTPGSTVTGVGHLVDVARHAVLPITTVTLSLLAQYTVNMRSSVIDVLHEDYILTARAIGLSPLQVRRRHVVPNALLPVVTVIGLQFGLVLGGVITIEAVFSWPGLGQLTLTAIDNKDYPVLQGLFLLTSAMVILFNLLTDLLYSRLDPRIRD
ncbi:ABC transporter permease [Segeticoccus rhizosphaerae]|uniref:ABC transporter permease n=1 Tax=Segeticoccus rhizosphaerae TaxID=1104777 RepID=UPI0010C12CC7|nr:MULTISPECIES: ABC transporter permease [Intrasporangiaceae]